MINVDKDVVMVSLWKDASVYLVDLNVKPPLYGKRHDLVEIADIDKGNINCSDLLYVPEFNYHTFPYIIKRGKVCMTLFDLKNRKAHLLFADDNGPWGY